MKKLVLLGCLLVIALLTVGGGVFLFTQIPPVTNQLPANSAPLLVTLSLPANGSTVPLEELTTITAEAIGGKPIATLELWIDGALTQKTSAPLGSSLTRLPAFWPWTPPSAGEHTLLVRASDADGDVAQSNLVRVTATKAEPGVQQAAYVPLSEESVPAIAVKFKTNPQTILDLNPKIDPALPLPPNQPINVPNPVPTYAPPDGEPGLPLPLTSEAPSAPASESSTPKSNGPAPFWFWLQSLFKADKLPSAPSLWAKTENCNVRLTIQDNALSENGFFVYRLSPASPSFERIATLDAHASSTAFDYVDSTVSPGKWQYFVAAFNTKGESPSGIVQVDLSGTTLCAELLKTTRALKQGQLTFKQPVEKAYCYTSATESIWTRMPPAPSAFIIPDANGAFDVSPWMSQLPPGDVTLEVECWGWQGSSLVYLGKGGQAFEKGEIGHVQMDTDNLHFAGELHSVPILKPLGVGDEKLWLAPPGELKLTGDAKACTSHMPIGLAVLIGAVTCQESIKDNYAILIWNWQQAFCPLGAGCVSVGKPDGYRVYRESFPTAYLFKDVKGDDMTVAMFPFPAPPWAPPSNPTLLEKIQYSLQQSRCYTVRAYKKTDSGIMESEDSNKVCLGQIQISKVTTLKPSASLSRFRYHAEGWEDKGLKPSAFFIPGPVVAGYEHAADGSDYYNAYMRGAVWFDLSQVPMPITFAALKYKFADGVDSQASAGWGGKRSCAYYLMLGTEDWRGDPYGDKPITIPAEDYTSVGFGAKVEPGDSFWSDVTTPVNEWLYGKRKNYGFVLRGADEVIGWKENQDCASVYDSFELEIHHYGQ